MPVRKSTPVKKKQPKAAPYDSTADLPGRDTRGDTITVGWMLTMLATTAADLLALVAFVIMPRLAAQAEEPGLTLALPRLLLFIAAIAGLVCITLTPAVYRFRDDPPPQPITIFGLVVSAAPMIALFWLSAR
jgi:hypothetical protein